MALVNNTQAPLAVAYYEQIRPHCHFYQFRLCPAALCQVRT